MFHASLLGRLNKMEDEKDALEVAAVCYHYKAESSGLKIEIAATAATFNCV